LVAGLPGCSVAAVVGSVRDLAATWQLGNLATKSPRDFTIATA
jgi:hypothetical protein